METLSLPKSKSLNSNNIFHIIWKLTQCAKLGSNQNQSRESLPFRNELKKESNECTLVKSWISKSLLQITVLQLLRPSDIPSICIWKAFKNEFTVLTLLVVWILVVEGLSSHVWIVHHVWMVPHLIGVSSHLAHRTAMHRWRHHLLLVITCK